MKAHNKGFSCTLFLSQLLPSSFLIFSLRSQLTHRSHQLIYKCFAFLKPQVPFIHMRVHWLSCTGWIFFYFILFYFFYRALHFCFLSSKLCCFFLLGKPKGIMFKISMNTYIRVSSQNFICTAFKNHYLSFRRTCVLYCDNILLPVATVMQDVISPATLFHLAFVGCFLPQEGAIYTLCILYGCVWIKWLCLCLCAQPQLWVHMLTFPTLG